MAKWLILGARLLFALAPLAASNVFAQDGYRAPNAQRCAVIDCTGGGGAVPGAPNPLWVLIGKLFLPSYSATHPPVPGADPDQQQRALAADQLNRSGLYYLRSNPPNYAGAIVEFQEALKRTPEDGNIRDNLQNAMRLQQDSGVAGMTNATLLKLLGNNSPTINTGNILNQVNLNPGGAITHLPAANVNTLNAILDDPGVVNLSSATKTSVDPQELKSQLYGVLGNHAPPAEPPDPRVQLPEARDIELLFQPPPSSPSQFPGPQRPADSPRLHNPLADPQEQEQINAKFKAHDGLDDILEKELSSGSSPEKAATPEKTTPAAAAGGQSPSPSPAPQTQAPQN